MTIKLILLLAADTPLLELPVITAKMEHKIRQISSSKLI
jgi:hypothetical protein